MKILVFVNTLLLGGTEKAACRWSRGLKTRGHEVEVWCLKDGPRHGELDQAGIPVRVVPARADELETLLKQLRPEVLHVHAPGFPHEGDVLGDALLRLPQRPPVVQTSIFGRLENPRENAWTDRRLFISWTSCVQAAHRAFLPLDEAFFRDKGVAVYPVDVPDEAALEGLREQAALLRARWKLPDQAVLFGRFSRPEPNKWTDLPLHAFLKALRRNPRVRLLLREPPPLVAEKLMTQGLARTDGEPDASRFPIIVLPATADMRQLQASQMACDAILHGSSIGESFGYGIAEPMALGKPVIANSTPWLDQAQIELVRHGECGFVASTVQSTASALETLAQDRPLRFDMGAKALRHIQDLADPEESLNILERTLSEACRGAVNASAGVDLEKALRARLWLRRHQFGSDWRECLSLFPYYCRVRFWQWRRHFWGQKYHA